VVFACLVLKEIKYWRGNKLHIKTVCKKRFLAGVTDTPLLVPSFSSAVGFGVKDILHKLKDQLTIASLVSAFDLWYENIDVEDIWYSKSVFIDSGVYENVILNKNSPRAWSLEMYENSLNRMQMLHDPILVNYDRIAKLREQTSAARTFFAKYHFAKKDFLFKRSREDDQAIDLNELTQNINEVRDFDIIGVTEKEIGRSMVARCQTILSIRLALNGIGSNLPIHVFGCLDPLSILAYFFCGADIFDGLIWLRHGFYQNVALHPRNFTLINKQWEAYDDIPAASMLVANLMTLNQLMFLMRRIVEKYDLAGLQKLLLPEQLEQLTNLLATAGVKLEET